jgi:hypothetical protein
MMTSDFNASDFNLIKDLSKEDIVEEIIRAQRANLMKKDLNELKKILIHARITTVHNRLVDEADLDEEPGGEHITFYGG